MVCLTLLLFMYCLLRYYSYCSSWFVGSIRNSWGRQSSWIVQKNWWKESSVAYGCFSLRVFRWWLILVKGLGRFADIAHGCQSEAGYCIAFSTLKHFPYVIGFFKLLECFKRFCLTNPVLCLLCFDITAVKKKRWNFRCFVKSSHWTIVDKINFRVFVEDEYPNPPKILWSCVASCKTLDSGEE